jgi:hypothetical protein
MLYTQEVTNGFNRAFCFEEVEEKSSHYGPDMLGYTRATRLNTNSYKSENLSKTTKIS